MKRFIDSQLLAWKGSSRRKPLLLRGARQVGKTYSVKKFASDHFSNHVVVDLEKHPDWHKIFETNLEPKRLLAELELVTGTQIVPGKTLLFMDEIQTCPRALMALRYFYEELPELHVIAAGSLMEFSLSEISFPVGRVQFLRLYPLSFLEFLWAVEKKSLADLISKLPVKQEEAPSNTIHQLLLEQLKTYLFVGGMPEVVKTYLKKQSFQACFEVQAELIYSYRQDFNKYAPRSNKDCLLHVLKNVLGQVGQQIKYSQLSEGFSNATIKKAFELLCQAELIQKVSATSPGGLPLEAGAQQKRFKALAVDLGLIHASSALVVAQEWSKTPLLSLYHGALAEQFVGQELTFTQGRTPYYWSRAAKSSSAEVDYLIQKENQIIPIEVKAGPSGRLKSLHLLMKLFPNCKKAWVFSAAPYAKLDKQKIHFLPLYYVYAAAKEGP